MSNINFYKKKVRINTHYLIKCVHKIYDIWRCSMVSYTRPDSIRF